VVYRQWSRNRADIVKYKARTALTIYIGTFLIAPNTSLLHFIKIFDFYELSIVFKKRITSDSNWWIEERSLGLGPGPS
jgi:hypothetical protein